MRRKKILILATGNIYERYGQFNALLNRTKNLIGLGQYEVDFILLSTFEGWLVRKLRNHSKTGRPKEITIDNVRMRIDWENFSITNYILSTKLHRAGVNGDSRLRRLLPIIKGYDFIIAHSYSSGIIACKAKQILGIPYSVTWHGSDIHTHPFGNISIFNNTKDIIESADVNLFVSDALRQTSNRITRIGHKEVIYNGCDSRFHKYDEHQRSYFRKKYEVEGKKVVTFVGSFMDVKNILLIPEIFKAIYAKENGVVFWMIGDGKYKLKVEELVEGLPVRFWGNQPPEAIPDFLNCTNVQILPSKNEGLPLTMVEALRCGCHAVGSLVGGIPEVIGEENCIPLDSPTFVQDVADRVLYFLNEGTLTKQIAAPQFDWRESANKEYCIMEKILEKILKQS